MGASRFRALKSEGTYFQLYDYSAISDEPNMAFAERLTREHGVAAIPISAFCSAGSPLINAPLLRFCFAKKEETLELAAARLRAI